MYKKLINYILYLVLLISILFSTVTFTTLENNVKYCKITVYNYLFCKKDSQ